MFYIFLYCYIMYYVFRWIEKWIILKSSCFSEYKKKEFIMYLCFLSIDKDYKNHIFFNLISKIWFWRKWIKIQVLIDSECESMSTIDMKYMQKQCLQTWKFEHNMILKNFNKKITWIIYLVIICSQSQLHEHDMIWTVIVWQYDVVWEQQVI